MSPLKFYNTMTRKKELFHPLHAGRVGLYTCGPTVYNFVHIGNLRTYIFEDLLRRTLEYAGYRVHHIMNTTDVDDKTIAASKSSGKKLKEFTREYERIFLRDLKLFNIKPPKKLARATEHIPAMIHLIEKLLKKKMAYMQDGSVYFSVAKFKSYGRLAHLDMKGLKAGARVDVDEYAKNAAQDFVLWKKVRPGEPSWLAPFGEGRPGWHIECSAMSMKYLGVSFDIHAGGVDLIFPHHENEIAQSESATGKKFVRCWLHGEHLLVDGKKMSKSLNNIFTLRDIEKQGFDPLDFRFLTFLTHYRHPLNFTWESLRAAKTAYTKLRNEIFSIKNKHNQKVLSENITKIDWLSEVKKVGDDFCKALADDLNMPVALSLVHTFLGRAAEHAKMGWITKKDRELIIKAFKNFDSILGLGLNEQRIEKIPKVIKQLAYKREFFRKEKKWQEADEVRKKIEENGFIIKDTPNGPQISYLKNRLANQTVTQ